jgi:DNA-directed RNA polymerase subunit RPC12/RpoP
MPIEKESVVAICGRCKRVRHEQACAAAACPTCGWHVQRKAVYLGSRTVGYL